MSVVKSNILIRPSKIFWGKSELLPMGLRGHPSGTTTLCSDRSTCGAAAGGKTHLCGKPWLGWLSFPIYKTETVLLIGMLLLCEVWMKLCCPYYAYR